MTDEVQTTSEGTRIADARDETAVAEAAAILGAGGVVALPTETVYGLAADATSPEAIRRIYAVKRRPRTNPLIVHIASRGMLRDCAAGWGKEEDALARALWPGPLTLVVRRSDRIPDEITAGGETVALRWPKHPVMQAVIRECGFPLAAPSANLSGRLSPTSARHVLLQLDGAIPLILDGGACEVGIESTVVDMVAAPPRILRPGTLSLERLRAVLPDISIATPEETPVPRSPGTGRVHYAPRAALRMERWETREELENIVRTTGLSRKRIGVVAWRRPPGADQDWARVVRLSPEDPAGAARRLYEELHRCDEAACRLILVEVPPEGSRWEGIRDRLLRAAGGDPGGGPQPSGSRRPHGDRTGSAP